MKCRRSEELWSDYVEGSLSRPLQKDVEEHFSSCADCRDLFAVFREVVDELHAVPRPAPSTDLVERILARTPVSRRIGPQFLPSSLPSWRGWAALGAAAAIALFVFGVPKPLADLGQRVNQAGHQTYSWGVRAYRSTDRLLDEITVLRMTVGVAFEDRLDRLGERIRDLQKAQQRNKENQNPRSNQGSSLVLTGRADYPNYPITRSPQPTGRWGWGPNDQFRRSQS